MLLAGALLLLGGIAMAGRYEEPGYEVEARHEGFEVRTYGPTVEARVTVPGTYGRAVSAAFRVLAGYIFGGNAAGDRIAMTTPVSAVPDEDVDVSGAVATATDAGWTVAFTMPSDRTLETLPQPRDPRIQLAAAGGGTWAVRTFSGRARDARVDAELDALTSAATAAGYRITGPPVVSQFDPPWTLGPWRRNEVRVPVTR